MLFKSEVDMFKIINNMICSSNNQIDNLADGAIIIERPIFYVLLFVFLCISIYLSIFVIKTVRKDIKIDSELGKKEHNTDDLKSEKDKNI